MMSSKKKGKNITIKIYYILTFYPIQHFILCNENSLDIFMYSWCIGLIPALEKFGAVASNGFETVTYYITVCWYAAHAQYY